MEASEASNGSLTSLAVSGKLSLGFDNRGLWVDRVDHATARDISADRCLNLVSDWPLARFHVHLGFNTPMSVVREPILSHPCPLPTTTLDNPLLQPALTPDGSCSVSLGCRADSACAPHSVKTSSHVSSGWLPIRAVLACLPSIKKE